MTQGPVLVTGASGFVARHCIAELLRRGFGVRGTLRDLGGADDVRQSLARAGVDAAEVEFVSADLSRDSGWNEAIAGVAGILHVASPFPMRQPRRREQVVDPARDGVIRVLAAATRAGIRRVVMTSSIAAIMYGVRRPADHTYSEDDWTDATSADITPYIASKAIAERAAWDYLKKTPGAPRLAVINPALILGPALHPHLSTSLEIVRRMARGAYPAVPRIAFPICDVRDVATAHALALTSPQAAGKRFLIANGNLTLMAIGRLIAAELPDLADKVPGYDLPDFLVRLLALFDNRLDITLPELGPERHCTSGRAREVLSLSLRSADEAVRATVRSLRDFRLI
jgi:dihydroflavonol-4-reductase